MIYTLMVWTVIADARVTKLTEQVTRQVAMIENLEKTLWGKK